VPTGSSAATTPSPIRRRHHVNVDGFVVLQEEGKCSQTVSLPAQILHLVDLVDLAIFTAHSLLWSSREGHLFSALVNGRIGSL
jgi:hypothetical protein